MEKRKVFRTKTIVEEMEVFPFSELSEEAKAVAIEKRKESNNRDFWWFAEDILHVFLEIGKTLGFKIVGKRYDMCGYSFTELEPTNPDLNDMDVRRTMAYVYNNWIKPYLGVHKNFEKNGFPSVIPDKAQKRQLGWKKAPEWKFYWNCPYTGWCHDYVVIEAYAEFLEDRARSLKPAVPAFEDFLKVLGEKMTKEIMDEAKYRDSDEGIGEELESRETLFLADGSVANLVEDTAAA